MKKIILKKSALPKIKQKNLWIYKNEIKKLPDVKAGEIVDIYIGNEYLATGYINPDSKITVRILSFEKTDINSLIRNRIKEAIQKRENLKSITNAYRIIHSEADLLPGLIADFYNGYIAIQINTAGMENLRQLILDTLMETLSPEGIIDKSDDKVRKKEGLTTENKVLYGSIPDKILITENNINFSVYLKEGQKTGFFLDQRKNRKLVSEHVQTGFKVLDLFSNAGGFGIYCGKKGADFIKFVDVSDLALNQVQENCRLNGITNFQAIKEDAFDFLKNETDSYDLIIVDPPSFAKSRHERQGALRGFKYLIVNSLKILNPKGYLSVFSCSHHISMQDLIDLTTSSAAITGDILEIKEFMYQDKDHPAVINMPNTLYLKGLLVQKR
ncbi:class I SAM-dependent rRNA methyltransferase [Persephonella sp. KM09-Lau-8]|uniref:class I SAM-dependent rRNA methyltransferase n=1 Tax=Persephonella sp. KM09-Lau-8 TaxID=1158345 RepID=UPI0004962AAC|nr:class I SAM-dependent rRNA methyltransferase [Persephonella sp. KM09-Lau-8]